MGNAIRVLVANQPRLIRELIFTTLSDQPDVEIVGEVAEQSEISPFIQRTLPDFVLIGQEKPGQRPAICDRLLAEFPQIQIIAVASDYDCSIHYWATPEIQSKAIDQSEDGILQTIRDGVRDVRQHQWSEAKA